MCREAKIANFGQVQNLVKTASRLSADVGVHDFRGSIADAKSILGLMSLDYSRPVKIVSEDDDALNRCLRAATKGYTC